MRAALRLTLGRASEIHTSAPVKVPRTDLRGSRRMAA